MFELEALESAIAEALPPIIARYREACHLTWWLIHEIEDELLEVVHARGKCSASMLRLVRAADLLHYPKDNRVVSFGEDCVRPITFSAIYEAWNHVH
ncbi:DUF2471 family protein [Cupriavidus basilensis]|uniref:DUF2471 family protein n=1 Tax=Cupriavidus basilensis TaxID=68895 RepID=UPI0039F6E31C